MIKVSKPVLQETFDEASKVADKPLKAQIYVHYFG